MARVYNIAWFFFDYCFCLCEWEMFKGDEQKCSLVYWEVVIFNILASSICYIYSWFLGLQKHCVAVRWCVCYIYLNFDDNYFDINALLFICRQKVNNFGVKVP